MKNRKEWEEPGKIYHVKNVIGIENLITNGLTKALTYVLGMLIPLRKLHGSTTLH